MSAISKHLNERQSLGLQKLGTTMLPGDGVLPPFHESAASTHVDRVLDYMSEGDRKDLKLLLTLLSFFPGFMILLLLHFLEFAQNLPGAGLLRFMRIGIRGLVMTLYYGDPNIHTMLGYDVTVYTGDLD